MTSIVAADVFTVSLAFDRSPPGLAVSDDALHPRKLCVVTAASSHVRLRLGVRRPRPPCRAESIGRAWALRAYSSRPARSCLRGRSGASLEVSHPLQHTSAASRAHSEGGRPPDLSRSGVLRSPYRPRSRATDLTIGECFALAVFRFISESSRRRSIRWTLWG
jgi:hypothetical protein